MASLEIVQPSPETPFWLFWLRFDLCSGLARSFSRGSRPSPPAARPQAPVRRKARPLSDLRPGAVVLAFAALAGMASRAPPRAPGDRGPLAPTRLPPVLALEKPLAVAWTTAH